MGNYRDANSADDADKYIKDNESAIRKLVHDVVFHIQKEKQQWDDIDEEYFRNFCYNFGELIGDMMSDYDLYLFDKQMWDFLKNNKRGPMRDDLTHDWVPRTAEDEIPPEYSIENCQ